MSESPDLGDLAARVAEVEQRLDVIAPEPEVAPGDEPPRFFVVGTAKYDAKLASLPAKKRRLIEERLARLSKTSD